MATNAGTLEVVITADTTGLSAALKNAREEINKSVPSWLSFGSILKKGIAAGFAAVGTAVTASVYAFGNAQKSAVGIAVSMRNQGIYSKEAFDAAMELASGLQRLSGVSDESIVDSQALLVSYGLQGKALDEVTIAALDLSIAKEIDLNTASQLLGKAFKGETDTLKRYGIIVDEMIPKSQRFAYALGQIQNNFGGSAEAKGKTFFGMIAIAKEDMSDYAEIIGAELVPVIQRFVQFMIDNRDVLMKAARDVGKSIREWMNDFADVMRWIEKNKGKLSALGNIFAGVARGPIGMFQAARGLRDFYKEPAFEAPATVPRAGPSPLVPAGFGGKGKGRGKGGEDGGSPVTFEQQWNDALFSIGKNIRITFDAVTTFVSGFTSTLSQGFQDVFTSIADGGTSVGEVLSKMGTNFRNLIFKVVSDIIAQWMTANILMMAITKSRQTSEIVGAAQVAAANNIAAMSSIPFGWIAGVAAAGAIIATVMSFAKFAEGGIVDRPTLGMVGEAGTEAIIPLKKGKEMGLFGGSGEGGAQVHFHFDGAALVDADEAKWDNIARRYIIPALAAYQDKTRHSDFRRWPTRT